MIFKARLSYVIPGGYISWRIRLIEEISGKVKIPDDYDIEDIEEVLKTINIRVPQITFGHTYEKIENTDALEYAVFEFEKTAPKKFKILRYIGVLKTETTTSIDTSR